MTRSSTCGSSGASRSRPRPMIAVCAFASWGAFLFMMSLYLQDERGFSAMHTGLIYLPVAVGALIFAPLSGRMVGRLGSRPSLLIAGALITAATLMLSQLTATTPVWQLLIVFAVFGIGFTMVNAPITNAAVSGMPTDRAGAASAIASTSRQIGVSLGVALCGSVAGTALYTTGADFAAAARPLWFVCAGLGVTIFVLGFFSTSPRALRSAERLAPLIAGPVAHGWPPMSRNPLADDVWRAMTALVFDNRDTWKRAVIEEAGLPFSRIRILRRLSREPMTVKELARAATMDAPAATVAINDLEGRGLVVREPDPTNRRCKVVSLTEAGRAVVGKIDAVDDPAPDVLAALDEAQLEELRVLLETRDIGESAVVSWAMVSAPTTRPVRGVYSGGDFVPCVSAPNCATVPDSATPAVRRSPPPRATPSTSR